MDRRSRVSSFGQGGNGCCARDRMEEGRSSKRVVVVGGGPAGSRIAKSLQSVADVVLIDPKEYYEVPWAQLRCAVEPQFAERTLINHKDYLDQARVVISTAVKVTEREVLSANGRWITYDYLVIATGHPNNSPLTRPERLQQFREAHDKTKASKSIMIIGRGPTGVELAAEIAMDFPDKQVTLVHKGSRLLEFISTKASNKAMAWLSSKNVRVLLNQEIGLDQLNTSQTEFVTGDGTQIIADCWFNCTGYKLGSSWLKEGILQDCLNEQGQVMVDQYLRIKGKKHIFAIGDINDTPEMKQGYIAHKHAVLTAKNLKLLLKGKEEGHLYVYRPVSSMLAIEFGEEGGSCRVAFPYGQRNSSRVDQVEGSVHLEDEKGSRVKPFQSMI